MDRAKKPNYYFIISDDTENFVETFTKNEGAPMTNLVDIFEETSSFNDKTFLLNLPPETMSILNNSTSLPKNQSSGAAMADVLSDPVKVKFLVKSIQNNSEDTLEFPDKNVVLRGASNDASKLTFWYEVTPKDGKSSTLIMRETMSTSKNLDWIFNKPIKKETNENNAEQENINTIAINFPTHDEGGTLYFPFYILMMLRSFCNSAEHFYTKGPELSISENIDTKEAEYLISLFFIAPQDCRYRNGIKNQVVDVITSLTRDVQGKDMEYALEIWNTKRQFSKPSRRNSLDYGVIIERYKKTLFMLGMTPGSFDELSQYIKDAKVLVPDIFNITFVSSIPNKTDMFSIPR